MKFNIEKLPEPFRSGLVELSRDYAFETGGGVVLTAANGEAGIKKSADGFEISYGKPCEFYREFVKLLHGETGEKEKCAFESMGIMLDCSRNAVLKVSAVKEYIRLISCMGYDTLMLYTEDTYEIESEPFFWVSAR